MFGISIEDGLAMLKPAFQKEGIKSIVIYMDGNEVKFQKLTVDIFEQFKQLVNDVPEAKKYLQNKKS